MIKGKIYRIVADETNQVYIGSTTQVLHSRMARHRSGLRNGEGMGSEAILQYPSARMELIETWECRTRDELRMREQHHISLCASAVNKHKAFITDEERTMKKQRIKRAYYERNRDKVIQRAADYYAQNRDKVIQRTANYYENNREKIKQQARDKYVRKRKPQCANDDEEDRALAEFVAELGL